LLAALAPLVTAGCQQSPEPGTRPLVVASVFPLYEFARQVAGDRAEVVSLVPAGVEPHDWEPSPRDIAQVGRARLFVYNGAGLEPWALKLQADLAGQGVGQPPAHECLEEDGLDLSLPREAHDGGERGRARL